MSAISKTTQGGAEFELLCRGEIRNYSFNPANLSSERKVKYVKRKLIQQLEQTVRELEFHSERRIAKIYIGKSFIQRRRKPGGGFTKFEPLDHRTWRKNGISSRWGEHKHHDYGRDGLVVLGAITRQTMPEKCRSRVHQEDFVLAMEQKLLHHYLLSKPDSRVVNETFTAGRAPQRNSYAYAIYMAFRYADTPSSSDQDDRPEEVPTSCLQGTLSVFSVNEDLEQSSFNHKTPSPSSVAHPTNSYSSPPPDSPPHSPPPRQRRLHLSLRKKQRSNITSTPSPNPCSSSSFLSTAVNQTTAATMQSAQGGESSRDTRNRIEDCLLGIEPGNQMIQSSQQTNISESDDHLLDHDDDLTQD